MKKVEAADRMLYHENPTGSYTYILSALQVKIRCPDVHVPMDKSD